VRGGRIAWLGPVDGAAPPRADAIVELGGALLTPAFVDSHVHLSETARAAASLSLGAARCAGDVLEAVRLAAAGATPGERILGHGWDESTWADPALPTPQELELAGGGREVFLSRADVHTALASSSMLLAAGLTRAEADTETGNARLRGAALTTDVTWTASLQRRALRGFAETGHAAVAEMAAPHVSGEADLRALLDLIASPAADALPAVHPFWGRLVLDEDEATAVLASLLPTPRWPGLSLGGDLSADGSIGARSAALGEDYADAPGHRGERLLESGQVAAHVITCVRLGVRSAFHAIGDAAVAEVLAGFELAAACVGTAALAAGGHRIEHAEGIDAPGIATMARLGLVASVQPRFDEHWGGAAGLYAARLGRERAAGLNPFAALAGAGVPLALGSDAPVTAADPWAAVRAAVGHHEPGHSLTAAAALDAHTRGAHAALGAAPSAGTLRVGAPACLAAWERLDEAPWTPGAPSPACLLTLRRGVSLHSRLPSVPRKAAGIG